MHDRDCIGAAGCAGDVSGEDELEGASQAGRSHRGSRVRESAAAEPAAMWPRGFLLRALCCDLLRCGPATRDAVQCATAQAAAAAAVGWRLWAAG